MRILMTDCIRKQYLQIFIYFLMSYDKVVQNRWRVGWVVISESILPQRSYTFACKWHNEAYCSKQETMQTKWWNLIGLFSCTHGKRFDNGLLLIEPCALHVCWWLLLSWLLFSFIRAKFAIVYFKNYIWYKILIQLISIKYCCRKYLLFPIFLQILMNVQKLHTIVIIMLTVPI
jgi:hypothetical protein